ncbi:MAG: sodium:solute symporter family protein [Phycisphaerales bacterium]|jgi:SSS family solute:Na+ symporter
MHLSTFDWILPIALVVGLAVVGVRTRRYGQSVAGFLAANRCAGRYLIALADARASIGLITLAWYFQQNYDVGYTSVWWGLSEGPVMIFLALTGWVAYRFRRTRALTLAQFLEMRYDRNFRIFCGGLAFVAGLLNYGVFPGISARFLIHLMGLPSHFAFAGTEFDTYLVFMVMMLSTALFFIFLGGQVTVMITDFLQGVFCNLVFAALTLYLLWKFPWSDLSTTLLSVADGKSLVNPAPNALKAEENFNVAYWAIQAVLILYTAKAWQGDQGYNASAATPHESKMANILNGWRFRVLMLVTLVVPLCIRTMMAHPEYAEAGAAVRAAVDAIPAGQVSELRTPVALGLMIPAGLLGFVIAAMFGAYLGTDNAYLHSWGSILVQDVVMPIRQRLGMRELSPKAHIRVIKCAIFAVACWGFFFSATFRSPDQRIAMYCNLSASLFYAGAGCAIIGGLYTRIGGRASAWGGMLTGVVIAAVGMFVQEFGSVWRPWEQSMPSVFAALSWIKGFNGQLLGFFAMLAATAVYVVLAFLAPANFDLDRLLHRGKHRIADDEEEVAIEADQRRSFWEKIGIDRNFTGWDRAVTWITLAWPIAGTLLFAAVTPFLLGDAPPSDESWLGFWRGYTYFTLFVGTSVVIWFTIGGFRDLRRMFVLLDKRGTDARDDGTVGKPAAEAEAAGRSAGER